VNGGDRLLVGKLLESSYLDVPEGTLYILVIIHPLTLGHSENKTSEIHFYLYELSRLPCDFSAEILQQNFDPRPTKLITAVFGFHKRAFARQLFTNKPLHKL
jgi:hypothetical protein